ncbi:DUF4861 domain-containing protein [bacterium]|nr:DUF4861 domain-containing protein [bacterium]
MRCARMFPVWCVFFLFSTAVVFPQTEGWYTEGDFAPTKRIRVTVTNTLDMNRKDCPVVITRAQSPVASTYEADVFVIDPTLPSQPEPTLDQKKATGSGISLKETNGHHIAYQLDDLDKDGVWDELFFMSDFKPRETKTFFVYIGTNDRGIFAHETHAEIGAYGRHIVPWWESKVMGWKLWYFSDVDLYGKREPMLVSNHENTSNISGYTAGSVYGNDIMTVEDSFGAGGICLFEDTAKPTAVSRPRYSPFRGKGQVQDTRYAFDTVVNGPLRSMIRVHIMNWRSGSGAYELEQLYTAYRDKSYSTCMVRFLKFFPEKNGTTFGCAIRKLMNEERSYHKGGVIMSFAKNVDIFDPDVQREFETRLNVAFIGTALVMKDSYKPEYRYIDDSYGAHAFSLPVNDSSLAYEYLIAAGWSDGSVNKTAQEFETYVLDTAKEYNNPVVVKSLAPETK